MGMVRTLGLVLHPQRNCSPALETITGWAQGHDTRVLGLAEETARLPGATEAVGETELASDSDLVVSLGGDGTMLRAMRLVHGHRAPVLGVNLGKLGFLAEIDIPELADALTAIDGHRFTVEPRAAVRATWAGGETVAFNDVALVRVPGRGGSAAVELRVEGQPFLRYAADALVVSTPTGSTAYAFSAGGPIVSPSAEGLLVIPSAPHAAFNRALFLSAGEKLELHVLEPSAMLAVEADGRVVGYVGPGDIVDVSLLGGAARVVRLGRTTFYQRAQRRLRLTGSAEVDGSL
jgi:NAD+ kinase